MCHSRKYPYPHHGGLFCLDLPPLRNFHSSRCLMNPLPSRISTSFNLPPGNKRCMKKQDVWGYFNGQNVWFGLVSFSINRDKVRKYFLRKILTCLFRKKTLWKENSFTPLPFGNLSLLDPPTARNFHDPPWGGYGYFLERHIKQLRQIWSISCWIYKYLHCNPVTTDWSKPVRVHKENVHIHTQFWHTERLSCPQMNQIQV